MWDLLDVSITHLGRSYERRLIYSTAQQQQGRIQGRGDGGGRPAPWPRMPRLIAYSAPGGAHFTEKMPYVGYILRWKCPRWSRFCVESAPGGADFAEKCPRWGRFYGESAQLGQISRRKCPRWGIFCGESAPVGADFAEMSYALFAPIIFFAPPPENSSIRPWTGYRI